MAETGYVRKFKYLQLPWGDLISGTESQLKALGLGVNSEYPKTAKQTLRVLEPRGFKASISLATYMEDGIYSASISFPGRENLSWRSNWVPFQSGVQFSKSCRCNHYMGSAEALIRAGLVDLEELPGRPGFGKMRVSINGKVITKVSTSKYNIKIKVSAEESEVRLIEDKILEQAWDKHRERMPRPPLLTIENGRNFINNMLNKRLSKAKRDKKFQSFLTLLLTSPKKRGGK